LVEHGALANYLHWAVRAYRMAGAGAAVHSSLAFDLTLTALLGPLLAGQPVTLIPEGDEIAGLAAHLHGGGHDAAVKLTPSHLRVLASTLPLAVNPPAVDTIVVGGEALVVAAVRPWLASVPGLRFFSEYGPTETVVGTSAQRVTTDDDWPRTVPLGPPIDNVEQYVLDNELAIAPAGVVGEVCIGGANVARGYLGLPALTAARFVPDPWSGRPGSRLYRTGDLGRYLPDGNIEFVGRHDDQVKVRGYRIELSEVEAALSTQDGVAGAAVVVRDIGPTRALVGYVAPAHGRELSGPELREALARRLPPYLVPATIRVIPRLPLTANGKVDRSALLEPMPGGGGDAVVGGEPVVGANPTAGSGAVGMTPWQRRLTDIWRDVLDVAVVGPDDNFFDLGGDSMLVVEVVERATADGIALSVLDLFTHQTIRSLATRIGRNSP
jgi:acyl-coenzyme A synthetase/AMP-(fatty) acid ligase/aryl carrier-like protein